jgi:hypothetical protein
VTGLLFENTSNAFLTWSGAEFLPRRHFPLWSVWAHARFGTAYIRAAVRNILDIESWGVYRYPEPGRSVVFEVTWSFID